MNSQLNPNIQLRITLTSNPTALFVYIAIQPKLSFIDKFAYVNRGQRQSCFLIIINTLIQQNVDMELTQTTLE